MTAFGSIAMQLSREQIINALEETFAGIKGIKGVHCCGNTDWSILLQTSAHIIHFDAYKYADSLAIYPAEVKKFLDRGGCVGWGVVPTDAESVNKESVASLKDRLESAMEPFTHKGIPFKTLIEQGCCCRPAAWVRSAVKRQQNVLCSCWRICLHMSGENTSKGKFQIPYNNKAQNSNVSNLLRVF